MDWRHIKELLAAAGEAYGELQARRRDVRLHIASIKTAAR